MEDRTLWPRHPDGALSAGRGADGLWLDAGGRLRRGRGHVGRRDLCADGLGCGRVHVDGCDGDASHAEPQRGSGADDLTISGGAAWHLSSCGDTQTHNAPPCRVNPTLHMAAKPVYHALKRLRQFEDRPMHDIRAIRENPAAFDAAMARRGAQNASGPVLALDEARRSKILAAETAQADQNRASKEVGAAKARGDEAEFARLRVLVGEKKAEVAAMQAEAKDLDAQLTEMLMGMPNLPHEDVPDGADEADNVELRRWGTPPVLDFEAREHYEIEGVKPGMDFESAAKLSGSRFVV